MIEPVGIGYLAKFVVKVDIEVEKMQTCSLEDQFQQLKLRGPQKNVAQKEDKTESCAVEEDLLLDDPELDLSRVSNEEVRNII